MIPSQAKPSQAKPSRKFTFIELLIVVAIIGILATLLLPSLDRARKATTRAVCLSNLAQNVRWTTLFSVDHNKKIPLQFHSGARRNSMYLKIHNKYQNSGVFYDLGYFGVEAEELLKCPSSDSPKTDSRGIGREYLDDDHSIDTTYPHVYGHYQVRPVTNARYGDDPDSLVPLYKYVDKAIISEYLCARRYYWNDGKGFNFHTQGNTTGFGDGHAKFIWDRDGTYFLNRIRSDNGNAWHWTVDDNDVPTSGLWWILDEEF